MLCCYSKLAKCFKRPGNTCVMHITPIGIRKSAFPSLLLEDRTNEQEHYEEFGFGFKSVFQSLGMCGS